MLLRGLGKLAAVVVLAGGAGIVLGIGLSALTGDDDGPRPSGGAGATQADDSTASVASPPSVARTSTTASTPTPTPRARKVRVTVLGAVLHPAGTPSGQSRQRARLGVRLRVENTAERLVTPPRPVLLVGAARVRFEQRPGDARNTRLGSIGAGKTIDVTLQFEVAGTVTEQLRNDRRARIRIAGRSLYVPVRIGSPVTPSATTTTTAQ